MFAIQAYYSLGVMIINIEIVNIFRIQVKMSTFVQFQLKIDENNLNVNKKLTSFFGAKALFKKKKI